MEKYFYIAVFILMVSVIVYVLVKNKQFFGISYFNALEDKYEISYLTGVENDQCSDHYDNYITAKNNKKCSIKFKSKNTNKNITRHNNGEICLYACILHYKDRIKILYEIIKFAIVFLNSYNAEWCLYYGGLVGLYTRKELLPWDSDIDIIIKEEDIKKMPPKYENDNYSFNMHDIKDENDDIIGRIIDKNSGLYSDITYYRIKDNNVYVKKMPTKNNPNMFLEIPYDKFYPIVKGYFNNGIAVPVPNDILYNIKQRYGVIKDDYVLVGEKYYMNR